MSAQLPGILPDQSSFSAENSGEISPNQNEPTEVKSEPIEPAPPETITQSSTVQQSEKVSSDNPKQSEEKPVFVSPLSINDGKLASGDSMANTTTGKVTPEAKLCEIEKEVEKLNISAGQMNNVPSVVVLKNETESLKNLMAYAASSDSEGEEEENPINKNKPTTPPKQIREPLDDTSSESDSDSSGTTLFSGSDSDTSENVLEHSDEECLSHAPVAQERSESVSSNKGAVKKECSKAYDEEMIAALPDLSHLIISDETEFMLVGTVSAIISECVTVVAFPNTPAFDLDSMLFICDEETQKKKPLGPIYDVLGPVSEPIYCVRFNNDSDVKTAGIVSGMQVYAAPKNEGLTKFVFVRELLKMKGTDASWLNDQEQPVEQAEFSDDEEERAAKRGPNKTSGKRKLEDNSVERHRRYERAMNHCNTLNTRVTRLMDSHRRISRQIQQHTAAIEDVPMAPAVVEVPHFNPAVPPPGYGVYGSSMPVVSNNEQLSFHRHVGAGPFEQPDLRCLRGSGEAIRRSLFNHRGIHRSSPNHHFANTGRNFRGPGPSSQPF